MSKSNFFENAFLDHVFRNANIANVGDSTGLRGSSVAGSLYISLHTANPGEDGTQVTSEATFTGYARVAVARTAGGWSLTDNVASNAAAITFAECTAGSNLITHVGIGLSPSGAGELIFYSALTASRTVSAGATFQINAGQLTITED
jgi:hypothetical protein